MGGESMGGGRGTAEDGGLRIERRGAAGVSLLMGREESRERGRDCDTRGSEKVTEGVVRELEGCEVIEPSRGDIMLAEARPGSVSVSYERSENAPGTRSAERRGCAEVAEDGARSADASVIGWEMELRAWGLRAVDAVEAVGGTWKYCAREVAVTVEAEEIADEVVLVCENWRRRG